SAELFVDGEKAEITWADNGKKAEVRVKPGTRTVEVKKDGFTAHGEKVEIESGGRTLLRARLETAAAAPPKESLRPLSRQASVWSGQWSVAGDQLVQSDKQSQFSEIVFGDFEWADYDFSAQAMRVEG